MKPTPLFVQPSLESIAYRLRKLRKERGWSLADVESISGGAIKAVVLGSYERSDRALSVKRAIELANLYSVPLSHLLSEPRNAPASIGSRQIVIDLRRARKSSSVDAALKNGKFEIFMTFISWIASQRSDWNGEVMSLRQSDLSILGLLLFLNQNEVLTWLESKELLLTVPSHS